MSRRKYLFELHIKQHYLENLENDRSFKNAIISISKQLKNIISISSLINLSKNNFREYYNELRNLSVNTPENREKFLNTFKRLEQYGDTILNRNTRIMLIKKIF